MSKRSAKIKRKVGRALEHIAYKLTASGVGKHKSVRDYNRKNKDWKNEQS